MNWPKIALLAYLTLGALLTVAQVGKPREPITPGVATLTLILTGACAWGVVIA